MKVAIIGHNILAFQQALLFENLGAAVTLFLTGAPLEKEQAYYDFLPSRENQNKVSDILCPEAVEILQLNPEQVFENQQALWENVYRPLVQNVIPKVKVRDGIVKRIQKRFLSTKEEIPNHSRLYDLFRVVFKHDPSGMLKEQVESNKQVFEEMPEEVIKSLISETEAFEDFDAVIETVQQRNVMGSADCYALNEEALNKNEDFHYGIISKSTMSLQVDSPLNIVQVGTDEECALNILALTDELVRGSVRLTVVTHEQSPFANLETSSIDLKNLHQDLFAFFDTLESSWQKDCELYQQKVHEWRALEPHVRVKVPEPLQPKLPLTMYNGYNVTSIDKLVDRDGLFLTIESPQFRNGEEERLKTLAADRVVVTNKAAFHSLAAGLRSEGALKSIYSEEPGFYHLKEKSDLEAIKENLLSFFTRN